MRGTTTFVGVFLGLIFCSFLFTSVQATVAGIDFGSEWFKVALVKGKTFEVVLNDQSSRKTASAVAFTEDLLVGGDAKNLVLTR